MAHVSSDQIADIRRILLATRLDSVGRSLDMGIFEFVDPAGQTTKVHIQSSFRVLQSGRILIGSRDMRYPQAGASPQAFDAFQTIYDELSGRLNGVLEQLQPKVESVDVNASGNLSIDMESKLRIEAFPDCSGPPEAWRVFVENTRHYVFPKGFK